MAATCVPAGEGVARPRRPLRTPPLALVLLTAILGAHAAARGAPYALVAPPGDQLAPAVAWNPAAQEYLVAWEHVYSATDHDVYAVRVSREGAVLGAPLALAVSTRWEGAPAVAATADGAYLVVWEVEFSAEDWDVYGHALAADGSPVGAAFGIAQSYALDRRPAVAPGEGQFLVVWEHDSGLAGAPQLDVWGQRVSGGAPVGAAIGVADAAGDELRPAVSWGPAAAEYLVAWQGSGGAETDILMRRVSHAGVPLGGPVVLEGWEYDQVEPAVAYDPTAPGHLVVWEDHHWGFGADWDIYARRVDLAGLPVGSSFAVGWLDANARRAPAVAFASGLGEHLAVFEFAFSASDDDVHSRWVGSDGALPLGELALSALGSNERRPAVASDGAYSFLAVWEDGRDAGVSGVDIWAERLDRWRFSGRVYEGPVGVRDLPLAGATVELRCSANAGDPGSLLLSAVTGADGRYTLATSAVCEYYQLLEIDPADFESSGAASVGGTVVDAGWIRYELPLAGRVLAENEFWDHRPDLPPGEWRAFLPVGWSRDLTVATSAQARDGYPGLDPATAQVAISRDGGAHWGGWGAAACTGVSGSTAFETLSGTVTYLEDSATQNLVRFRIADTGGQVGTSPAHVVPIDGNPPVNPAVVGGSHPTATWTNQPAITLTWPHGTDATSGVAGYSFVWTTAPGSLPDTGVDTADNHLETAIPGDGASWYFHLRTGDVAGNWAAEAVRAGAYWLDTAPPANPTLLTASHVVGAWSSDNTIAWQWNDGSDPLSGVLGYSFAIDQVPTTLPDAAPDTVMLSVGSPPLADGAWYFHLRAVDRAGNGAAGALHAGPYPIDTTPPSSAVLPLASHQISPTFLVQWSGSAGGGSPLVSFDVRVEDLTSGETWEWQSQTTATAAWFPGSRGHTYLFASRARDAAGNVEPYPLAGGDAMTTVGVSLPVRVRDESGAAVAGAKVYHLGLLAGFTDASGLRIVPYALNGDELAALHLLQEFAAGKPNHQLGGGINWSHRVYRTSFAIDDAGDPQVSLVIGAPAEQTLTVRGSNPLFGFHVVVAVEFDATPAFLADLRQGVRNASDYLYDATDGQFFWDVVEIFDHRRAIWDSGEDVQIHASTEGRAWAIVGGIAAGSPWHTNFNRGTRGGYEGGWTSPAARAVLNHEWGHYAFHLGDEYVDRAGREDTGANCATSRTMVDLDRRASVMCRQDDATEYCSDADSVHHHDSETQHDAENGGESTWQTIARRYRDSATPQRWTLTTPDDRGTIVPGPMAMPIQATTVLVNDVDSGACLPFDVTVTQGPGGPGAWDAWVHVEPPAGKALTQGLTKSGGRMTVVGAHVGDTVRATRNGLQGAAVLASCGDLSLALQPLTVSLVALVNLPAPLAESPGPVEVEVRTDPVPSTAPQVELWQDGAAAPLVPACTWDAVREAWVCPATLDPQLGPAGQLRVAATSGAETRTEWPPFQLHTASAASWNWHLSDPDDQFRLVLPPGAVAADTVVAVTASASDRTGAGQLVRIGSAYEVRMGGGGAQLALPGVVNLRVPAGLAERFDLGSLEVHRWDAGLARWVRLPGGIDARKQVATASTTVLTTFALFGRELGPGQFSDGFELGGLEAWTATMPGE